MKATTENDSARVLFFIAVALPLVVSCFFIGRYLDVTASLDFRVMSSRVFVPAGGYILCLAAMWLGHIALTVLWPGNWSKKNSALAVLLLALLVRLLFLPQTPSDDVNRYLWEGKILANGLSPYVYAARTESADAAQPFRTDKDPFWSGINHPEMTAIYPPLFQLLMAGLSGVSYTVTAVKLMLIAFDLAIIVMILLILNFLKLDLRWSLLYALNSVIITSFAGQAHQDGTMIFFLLSAIFFYLCRNWRLMFIALGLSIQMKYFALLCLPFFIKRENLRHIWLLLLAGLGPFAYFFHTDGAAMFASLTAFGQNFTYNACVPFFLGFLNDNSALTGLISNSMFVILLLWGYWRFHPENTLNKDNSPVSGSFFALALFLLFAPTVHYWYVSWIIPFICFRPGFSWLLLTLTISFSLTVFANHSIYGNWDYPAWAQMLVWVPPLLLIIRDAWQFLQRNTAIAQTNESAQTFSVIIPVKNEAAEIEECLRSISDLSLIKEIIVVDGGSTDATVEIARSFNAKIVVHNKAYNDGGGRGGQICAGIKIATGDIIMVLHADTRLQADALQVIVDLLQRNPDVVGGAIGSAFVGDSIKLRLLEFANHFRAAFQGISFGDQVQFCRHSAQKRLQLFCDIPLMEDVEFALRANAQGRQVFLWGHCQVSSRKWQVGQGSRAWLIISLLFRYLWQRMFSQVDCVKFYERYYGR